MLELQVGKDGQGFITDEFKVSLEPLVTEIEARQRAAVAPLIVAISAEGINVGKSHISSRLYKLLNRQLVPTILLENFEKIDVAPEMLKREREGFAWPTENTGVYVFATQYLPSGATLQQSIKIRMVVDALITRYSNGVRTKVDYWIELQKNPQNNQDVLAVDALLYNVHATKDQTKIGCTST